jgi:hypothetical protein
VDMSMMLGSFKKFTALSWRRVWQRVRQNYQIWNGKAKHNPSRLLAKFDLCKVYCIVQCSQAKANSKHPSSVSSIPLHVSEVPPGGYHQH